jgi:uncharacterized protein (DUF58 family)
LGAEPPLLTRDDVRQLERLSLVSLGAIAAGLIGQREGAGRGQGVEFADYRPYTPGDDVRRIDWNVYARLRELLIKTSPQEARVWLSVLLDTSRSMDYGRPNKLRYGRRLATLLGTVALLRADRVQVQVLSDGGAVAGGQLDAGSMLRLLSVEVERLPEGRTTDLARSIRAARAGSEDPELAVLITDGMVPPGDLSTAVSELARFSRSAALVHIVDPADEVALPSGDVELRDLETAQVLRVVITDEVRQGYEDRYRAFGARVEAQCRANGINYVPAPTSVDPLELLLDMARSATLIGVTHH